LDILEDVLLPVLSYAEALVVVLALAVELELDDDVESVLELLEVDELFEVPDDFSSSLTYDFISFL
jgi:hypothetical protein